MWSSLLESPSMSSTGLAFWYAVQAALCLALSHALSVGFVMYMDLSGRWEDYALCTKRQRKSVSDYLRGFKSFSVDLGTMFIPCMTFCLWRRVDTIASAQDDFFETVVKLVSGYIAGKMWAFGIHYLLHHPALYPYHRRHHQKPSELVASAAWEDSVTEYAIMEIPSFLLTLILFPTHWWAHLLHFAFHGLDGAAGHSGFKAPGILGYIFDGEYHYYHHAHLTVNYAELEFLDKLCGTHHSQQARFAAKKLL